MLNMGFAEDVETILAGTPEDKQLALFSATIPPQIRRIIKKYAPGATEISVKSTSSTATNVTQRYLKVAHPQKLDALTRILEVENFDGMIVFVRTKQATEDAGRAAARPGLLRRGDQRRRRPGAARAHDRPAAQGKARHPGRHRRRRARPRRRADQPRDQPRHPHRHRVLRAPHRSHRPRRPQRRRRSRSSPRARPTCCASIEKANRTTLEQMSLPTVEDVNAFRVAKFTEAIGQALGDPQLGIFRELVQAYEQEHDVPAEDIAAAIAVLAQDGEPLFLEDMPEPVAQERRERRERSGDLVRWRISVGKRHRVEPRQIVGALANEGGLKRADFGRIDIKPNFSLVELPAGPVRRDARQARRTPASPGS